MHYLDLPISKIHEALVAKKVTPLELTKEALKRAHDSKDNAFELLLDEEALSFASTLTEPEEENLLWGIPYLAKDNFSTKGIVTTASSNVLNGYKPLYDAHVIDILKQKKAVLIGKTTLDELAMGGTGTTGHLGITYNPYDPKHERMMGGSSCGSAAAIAAGIVPFALGSDTGDSVRKPASYGGIIGVKPTWGRISRYGLFPFAPSLDHVGYFTRYVEDAALLCDVLSGRDVMDSTSSEKPVPHCLEKLGETKKPTFAVLNDIVDSIRDPEILKAFDALCKKLEEQGCEVKKVAFGKEALESIYATYIVISCAEATSNDANLDGIKFGPYYEGKTYQDVMFNARTKGFSELIKRRFVIGSFCLMAENQDVLFLRAQRNRAKIVAKTNEILSNADFILVPAAPSVAPKLGESSDKLSDEYLIADNHLALGNFAGLPSVTLPLGYKEGMPFGVNLMGRAFEEEELFQACKKVEAITGLEGSYYGKEGN